MRKILTALVVLLFAGAALPGIDANTETAEYDIPSGPNGNLGSALSTRLCAEEWDDWDEGQLTDAGDELVFGDADDNPDDTIGEAAFTPAFTAACGTARDNWADDGIKMGVFSAGLQADEDLYTTFVATITDTNFDNAYMSLCIFTGGDNVCQTDAESPSFSDPDGQVDYRADGCNSVTVQTAGELAGGPEHGPSAFVYATYVDPDSTDPCFASSGVVSIVMS